VFGSTINEVARLETLTKTFATPIVGSEEFTAYCRERRSAARALRGVNAP
jgi:adenylate cyclase